MTHNNNSTCGFSFTEVGCILPGFYEYTGSTIRGKPVRYIL